ncbi:Rne/Rng family ribonuclease [Mameliella sediminis]|uniref:Rne/Rng family ribonuclease n=1 Tax=Mameliella sediminis TaxID=2836866 RepID=UPI001C487CEE|nr:ribonuclease E/G [Mameliella sediminis]MBV7392833.1 Rne/Rng family ribonuclease [Mameliella sediminis]
MAKKMLIDATHAEETRVVVVDGNKVEEFDFESENKRQLAGNIYLAKVTRVEPSLQAAFVDYGGNRHGFLAFSEIHPDYYQIPVADRQALMEEEEAAARAAAEEEEKPKKSRSRSRKRSSKSSDKTEKAEQPVQAEAAPEASPETTPDSKPRVPSGMETIDLSDDLESGEPGEGLSPMATVHETPVEEPVEPEAQPAEAPAELPEPVAETVEAAPAEVPAPDAVPAEEPAPVEVAPTKPVAEEAPAEDSIAATQEAPAPEGLSPLEPMASAEPQSEDAGQAAESPEAEAPSDEDDGDTIPPRPIAEGTKDEAEVVTQEPASADAAEPEAPEQVDEAKTEDPEAEIAETATPEAATPEATEPEAVEVVEEAAAEVVETPVAEPAAAEVTDTVEAEEAPEEEADTAEAEDDAEDAEDEDEDDGKEDAAARDASIESVADDDTEEDIRPARKPRPRRYKIQEVIKVRQIMLVQVVKEERGNKGAALTTYLSLAGRYCVLMPNTARGGGISRKITNATDRSKLKEIAQSIDVPKGAGLIIRTAGAKRTKTEIKRDYEYLQRLWEQIRELTLKSIAPAKIYEEGDLIKRSIRDLYSREIDEVLVEGDRGYRVAKDFMKMIMPSHAKNVKHYTDPMPLFARYQVESYLGGMFNPTVQLKSGGYIVIGVTEALVAIDVNSGRATKEGSIEETALKTNLEAAEEVARQLRLRDLAGLIVIDFIDMDERKNNAAVEKKLKDKLKTDRARIQVGRISGFGLLEMSRQRLRPGMIEATTQPCAACHGTGLIRSDDNMALQILRQIEEEGVRRRSREVLVKCPIGIANYLMNQKREHVAMIEARYGMSVRIEGDPHLVAPDFSMEKFKTATRVVPEATAPVVSVDTSLMDQVDEDAETETEVEEEEVQVAEVATPGTSDDSGEEGKPKKRRRRRRRKSKSKEGSESNGVESGDETGDGADNEADAAPAKDQDDAVKPAEPTEADAAEAEAEEAPKPKRSRSRSRRSRSKSTETEAVAETAEAEAAKPEAEVAEAATPEVAVTGEAAEAPAAEEPVAEAAPAEVVTSEVKAPEVATPEPEAAPADVTEETEDKPKRARTRRKASDVIAAVVGTPITETSVQPEETTAEETAEDPAEAVEVTAAEPTADVAPEPVAEAAETEADDKPKRRGWWSLGR